MKTRISKITVILFCLFIAGFALAFLVLPGRDFSPQENRALAQAPELTAKSLFSGEFTASANEYAADQFPLRDRLLKLKSAAELALLKGKNNGVLYSRGQLAVLEFEARLSRVESTRDCDGFYADSVSALAEKYLSETLATGLPVVTLIPPRTIDVAGEDFSRPGHGDALYEMLAKEIPTKGFIDLLTPFREKYSAGEYVVYRTDHHWTTAGAYYAYTRVMQALGREPETIPENEFDVSESYDFSGTTAARANFPFYRRDTLSIWTLPDEDEYKVIADGVDIGGFYSRKHLETSDKYSVFLDGTHAVTTVTKKSGEARETLLVIRDSFGNSLIPFLARHFDIVAVDVNTSPRLESLVEEYSPFAVLTVVNGENVIKLIL